MVLIPRRIATRAPKSSARTIRTPDGFDLVATVFESSDAVRATIVIHGATATPQRYYRHFAKYAAWRGYRVVTYDYRGIGASRPNELRGFEATMTDWAKRDARAVIDRVIRDYPGPRFSIGHSFGGQLIGLIDDAHEVDAAILVSAQVGYYGHWPARDRPRLAATWYGLVPVVTSVVGYMPGSFGLGVDLPKGVAREWARWCRSPGYLTVDHDDAVDRFARFTAPTRAYSFTDDDIGPGGAVDALLDLMTGADIEHMRLSPDDLGVERLGHFGFFRKAHADLLWRDALAYLDGIRTRPRMRREEGSDGRPPASEVWLTSDELMSDLQYGQS
jgi:predicted alpha/beta hydrolase